MVIRRGDIYYADLRPVVGSEQAQPDSDLCRHYITHVKGKAANACCN